MTTTMCDRCKKPIKEMKISLRIGKEDLTLCESCTERLFGVRIVGIEVGLSGYYKEFLKEIMYEFPGFTFD